MPIHHLQLWVPDLRRAERSWGWLLEELGFALVRRWDHGRVWREGGTGIAIEQSPDMVPGMLHSRLRPGLNHVAFDVGNPVKIKAIVTDAPHHGWRPLGADPRHPLAADQRAAYLEDADGFEVELICTVDPDEAPG